LTDRKGVDYLQRYNAAGSLDDADALGKHPPLSLKPVPDQANLNQPVSAARDSTRHSAPLRTAEAVLALLEHMSRDGLVHDTGARRNGQPIYELTEEGLKAFSALHLWRRVREGTP
jgi:hypothetical protein